MNTGEKVVYLGRGAADANARRILQTLRELAGRELKSMAAAAMDEVDDALFDRAERAFSNADQQRHFAAMRRIRLQRRDIEARFLAGVEAGFERVARGAPPPVTREEPPAGLALMDDAVVEENVAVDTVVGKGRSRHAFPLAQIVTRLDHLLGTELAEDDNPVDPRPIVNAFAEALEALEIEIQPRLVLYKVFEKHMLRCLENLYSAVNRTLIDAGVLPRLAGTGRTGDRDSSAAASRPQSSATAPSSGAAGATERESVLTVLSQLIAEAKYGSGSAVLGPDAVPGQQSVPVVEALSGLQREWQPPAQAGADADAIKSGLVRALERLGHAGGIGRSADDTIDIVGMLFDVILEDPRLGASIKAQIARLQIPVLKVAFIDRSFFSNRQHPTRQLINEMAHAAAGWVEPEDPTRDPLYQKLREAVEHVLAGFEQDTDVFAAVLQDFRRFLEQERERARLIEDRTRQAAEGKARVEDARAQVQAEVNRRLAVEGLPEVVRRLLGEAWFKVLFITRVKEGEDGENWHRHVELMDRLVWSVRPKTDPAARKRMLADMPALLHDLRDGLNDVLCNPSEMTRLFRELEVEHIRCLSVPLADDSTDPGPVPPPESAGDDTAEPAALDLSRPEQPTGETIDDEFLERLRTVDLGTWFEFCDDDGREQRAKLSARLNGGNRLIFVNRAGFKLADRPADEVAAALKTGRAVVLDDNALFDRALESVITNLRELREAR